MIFFKQPVWVFGLFALIFFFFPLNIYSYIDPGTGSYVFQIIIATFVAVSFALKVYWNKIKILLKNLFKK